MSKRKPYDYAEACIKVALRAHPIGDDFVRVLRKLVRKAAIAALDRGSVNSSETDKALANELAKEIIP
jgi:vacuolar-type H+-ATPase subunit C/Vma6